MCKHGVYLNDRCRLCEGCTCDDDPATYNTDCPIHGDAAPGVAGEAGHVCKFVKQPSGRGWCPGCGAWDDVGADTCGAVFARCNSVSHGGIHYDSEKDFAWDPDGTIPPFAKSADGASHDQEKNELMAIAYVQGHEAASVRLDLLREALEELTNPRHDTVEWMQAFARESLHADDERVGHTEGAGT